MEDERKKFAISPPEDKGLSTMGDGIPTTNIPSKYKQLPRAISFIMIPKGVQREEIFDPADCNNTKDFIG